MHAKIENPVAPKLGSPLYLLPSTPSLLASALSPIQTTVTLLPRTILLPRQALTCTTFSPPPYFPKPASPSIPAACRSQVIARPMGRRPGTSVSFCPGRPQCDPSRHIEEKRPRLARTAGFAYLYPSLCHGCRCWVGWLGHRSFDQGASAATQQAAPLFRTTLPTPRCANCRLTSTCPKMSSPVLQLARDQLRQTIEWRACWRWRTDSRR